jgi:hypothetical protein
MPNRFCAGLLCSHVFTGADSGFEWTSPEGFRNGLRLSGTDRVLAGIPGTTCQATIIQSLRDKSPSLLTFHFSRSVSPLTSRPFGALNACSRQASHLSCLFQEERLRIHARVFDGNPDIGSLSALFPCFYVVAPIDFEHVPYPLPQ